MVDIYFANLFMESVFETFVAMARCEIPCCEITLVGQAPGSRAVVAVIGVNGLFEYPGDTPK